MGTVWAVLETLLYSNGHLSYMCCWCHQCKKTWNSTTDSKIGLAPKDHLCMLLFSSHSPWMTHPHPQPSSCKSLNASGGGGNTEGGRLAMPSSQEGRQYRGHWDVSSATLLSSEGRVFARLASHSSSDGSCCFFSSLFRLASSSAWAAPTHQPYC